MSKRDTLDIISQALMDPSVELNAEEMVIVARLRDTYTFWLGKPTLTDTNIRDYLMANFKVSKMQAYRDLANIKLILGNIPVATKEFYRYKANHILDEAHSAAMAGNDKRAKALTKIAEAIAYNNRTNEDDGEKLPFDKIIPQDLSFSVDPEVAGVKRIPGVADKAKKVLAKYEDDIELNYTDYEEQDNISE